MNRSSSWRWMGLALASAALAMWVPLASAQARPGATRPATTRHGPKMAKGAGQAGCVREECHAKVKDFPVLHGPTAVHACDACHVLIDADAHQFKLAREKAALCTYCHDFDPKQYPVVHKPVALGECLGCHDPHGGQTHALVREKTIPQLCGRCHESVTSGLAVEHTPVKQGDCVSCHAPHGSRFPKLLDATGPDLCMACHTDMSKQLSRATFVHGAIQDGGCQQCHDPHGSANANSLTYPVQEMCVACHESVQKQIQQATVKHSVATEGDGCVTCHTPHGGDVAKLMKDTPLKVCSSCHVNPPAGSKIPAVPEVADASMHKHTPVRDGQCGGCHAAHGGQRDALLTASYTHQPYRTFEAERYELCFQCHDVKLATAANGTGLTEFRNGTRNLHQVHVNGARGESCSMCHGTHAAANEKDVRDTATFGAWNMPIRYVRTGTGGACTPGCHVELAYDREHPAATTGPATTRAAVVVRAQAPPPPRLALKANDVDGKGVQLPDPERPTVILLARNGDPQNVRVLREFSAAMDQNTAATVVVVMSGPAGDAAAAPTLPVSWLSLDDPAGSVSRDLRVFAWPTLVIAQPDGRVLTTLSATSEAMPLRLRGYLGAATTRPSTPATSPRLALRDPMTSMLGRADALLDESKIAEVDQLLKHAMGLRPSAADRAQIEARMARAAVMAGRGYEALDLLGRLQPGALPPATIQTLRAEALIGQSRWPDARAALERALGDDPNLPRAHFLMGRVHEQAGQWEQAAREYRLAGEKRTR